MTLIEDLKQQYADGLLMTDTEMALLAADEVIQAVIRSDEIDSALANYRKMIGDEQ